MLAFDDSSLRWKGASYPDMVQITLRNPIMNAKPVGHSVPLTIPSDVQTSEFGFVFGVLILPTGIQITKTRITTRLTIVPTLLRCPINFVAFMVKNPSRMSSANSRR